MIETCDSMIGIQPQVANEINSRRINDELTIFSGIHHSPIFMAVIIITCVFQSLIIYTPIGRFFKVRPPSPRL